MNNGENTTLDTSGQKTGPDFEYEYFKGSTQRRAIFDACARTAEYAIDNEIENMIFIDRSARPMWAGVREFYKLNHSDLQIPDMYFVNPSGFRRPVASYFNRNLVAKNVETQHPHLFANKDKPTMLIDTCIHSGRTVIPIGRGLARAGFNGIHVAVVSEDRNYSPIKANIELLGDRFIPTCYPFGQNNLVQRNYPKTYGKLSTKADRDEGIQVRTEMKQIIRDYSGGELSQEDMFQTISQFAILGSLALEIVIGNSCPSYEQGGTRIIHINQLQYQKPKINNNACR